MRVYIMFKSCSVCGKIHDSRFRCYRKREYDGGAERRARSSNKWTEKSREIRERAHHLCELCRDEGRITYDGIEVHHIIKVRDNQDLLLDNMNLICLCKTHHLLADKGEISVDRLKKLAWERETGK